MYGVPGIVGLENLKSRLDILYADRYRLQTAEEAGWVSVKVALPFHGEDKAEFAGRGDAESG